MNQEVENYKRNQIDGDSEQEAVDEKPETETAPEQEQESAEGDINMIDLRDKQQLPENQEEADTSTLPDGAASAQDNQGDLLDPEEEPLDFSEAGWQQRQECTQCSGRQANQVEYSISGQIQLRSDQGCQGRKPGSCSRKRQGDYPPDGNSGKKKEKQPSINR